MAKIYRMMDHVAGANYICKISTYNFAAEIRIGLTWAYTTYRKNKKLAYIS